MTVHWTIDYGGRPTTGATSMPQVSQAAVRVGPGATEMRELPIPSIGADNALLRVEVAGICGTDARLYIDPPIPGPVIMGHENVGTVVAAGPTFTRRHGVGVGDRVFVEHYVACYSCEWCRAGEYRHCLATDWRVNPDARRFGYTSLEHPGTLWGGFSQYMFLPWNAVVHRVPDELPVELAGVVTPVANGIEWSLYEAGVGYGDRVLVQGPGQQGLAQTLACHRVGASQVIVTGTRRDAARLALARTLGATDVVDIDAGDPLEQIMDLTGGRGVDVVLDCTSRAGTAPVLLGIAALRRRGGRLLVQGELAAFPDFPLKQLTEKGARLLSARGHSYRACEAAIAELASGRAPLERLTTHLFELAEADRAIRAVAGELGPDVIHVSLLPWGAPTG